MDKQIYKHRDFVIKRAAEISKIADENRRENERTRLSIYNAEMTRNFQHERAIHLAITLFFVVLTIAALALLSVFVSFEIPFIVLLPLLILAAILTILEGFYIVYYYQLENRIAKIYGLARRIYELK